MPHGSGGTPGPSVCPPVVPVEETVPGHGAVVPVPLAPPKGVSLAPPTFFLQHMMAGAVAGMAEHSAMYPVDTIKTRMQALGHPGQQLHGTSVARAVSAVLREGWRGLYAGIRAQLLGTGPAHAIYFAVYEEAKTLLVDDSQVGHAHLATAGAGALATIASDTFNVPFDTVKQRLQVRDSPYKGVVDCVRIMVSQEGVGSLFKSLRTTILMNVPFVSIHFSTYEAGKRTLEDAGLSEGLQVELLAGGTAGGLAAAVTTPLDVVKTRLQLSGFNPSDGLQTSSVRAMMRRIVREEGMRSLWRGLQPRVMFHVPSAAVCWGTYETCKRLLSAPDLDASH